MVAAVRGGGGGAEGAEFRKTPRTVFTELPEWCDEQRQARSDGTLTPERQRRLNEMGFDWGDKAGVLLLDIIITRKLVCYDKVRETT
jgi:hypothetical protein